jgi:hypothetical protein
MSCPDVGKLPDDYSNKLPRGVPPAERAPTSFFPYQSIGPADVTWYFPIGLDQTNPTGVFLPQGFGYPKDLDVILFFHGNKQGIWENINQYWHGDVKNITLREDLNDSRRNAVLVAPTMGSKPGWGGIHNDDIGIFGHSGGGNCFLDHVMKWLGKYEPHYSDRNLIPEVGNVVLAGHSGGGNAIHAQMDSMKASVCEIWGFDIVLGGADDWINFARFNPTVNLTFFHAIQNDEDHKDLHTKSEDMKLKNLVVNETGDATGAGHYRTLTLNFPNQVKNTTCFSKR